MSLITVSREAGSLGDESARLIAETLNYSLLDRQALEQTIDGEGFPDISLERYDEQSPSFWENFTSGKDVYLDRLRTALLESASRGNAVALGRGGQFALHGVDGVFRVRFVASPDVRVNRLSEILECDVKTAERYMKRSDRDRSGFSRFFFGGNWNDPCCYDITLTTDNLNSDTAAEIIRAAYMASPASRQDAGISLKNRLIAQKVRNKILYVERIPVDLLEIESDNGHVVVRGTVTVKGNADRCEKAAETVEGVKSVEGEVYFVNPVMTY